MNFECFIDLIETDDTIVESKTSKQTMNRSDIDNYPQLTAYTSVFVNVKSSVKDLAINCIFRITVEQIIPKYVRTFCYVKFGFAIQRKGICRIVAPTFSNLMVGGHK